VKTRLFYREKKHVQASGAPLEALLFKGGYALEKPNIAGREPK
jgi:hypothetical protein